MVQKNAAIFSPDIVNGKLYFVQVFQGIDVTNLVFPLIYS